MPQLNNILPFIEPVQVTGTSVMDVTALCIDSRKVIQGCMFIAIGGTTADGHLYIDKAVAMGATSVLCERLPETLHTGITYMVVKNTSIAAGYAADAFYNHPTASLKVIGVTGTNGKTTTATLLFQLFEGMGYKCGLISTVQNHIHDKAEPSTHTTPDAVSLHKLFRKMADAGCSHVFMEVSSHAIHQHRIAGVRFAGGLFTNITHDHLDYHKTFDEYIRVKKAFFDALAPTAFALTNVDDKRGMVMLQNTRAAVNTYSLREPATIKGKILENNLTGLIMIVDGVEAYFRMIGTFNAYNLLAVYGAALLLGEDKMNILATLSNLQGAPGRFETLVSANTRLLGIVDYAHTPDALINVLATINQLRTNGQQLYTIIGCGGDRDKAKRPIMAEVACSHSDKTIITSDNPRSEEPDAILNDMEAGLTVTNKRKCLRIADRRAAIKTACMMAKPGDVILVAGKGHESYQEIKGIKHHFDDREELEQNFKALNL